MKLNKNMVIFGGLLLLLLLASNIIYYEKQVLKEPLFVKHYYDVKKGINDFRLYYVQNINSQDRVVSIVFPEIGQQPVSFNESNGNTDRRYYMLKTLTVNISNGGIDEIPVEYKNKVITKAKISFSNGKTMNINLGKIYLYNDEVGKMYLEQRSVSGSSDHTGSSNFISDKDLNIVGISSKFYEETKDILQINIDEYKLSNAPFPMKLKAGCALQVSYGFKVDKKDIRKNNAYNFTLNVLNEDLQGNKGSGICFVNFFVQSPEYLDIEALKDARGRE